MKDIGRSMAAKRQPRTPDGRFASEKTYVVMDEWGNVSPYEPKEETFGYTTAVTRNPRKMGKLAQWYRATNGTDKEVKASDKLWGRRIQMAVKIRSTDIKSKAYYVDKRRPPIGWVDADNEKVLSKRKRSNERNKIREQLLEDAMKKTVNPLSGDVTVIVDNHDGLKNANVKEMGRRLSVDGKRVEASMCRSQDTGLYSDMLQTNDHITNAARSATKGFPLRAICMRISIHRYRTWEKISK